MASHEDNAPLLHDSTAESNLVSKSQSARPRARRTTLLVVLCILFVELCERLTFYGVTANLVFYCKYVLKLASPLPSTITLGFQGTCFFTPVIGGWLADTFLGRYNTIYGCSLFYVVGTALLTATTYSFPAGYALSVESKEGFLAVSLILIAIGTGGIKANVSPLGADLVEDGGPEAVQKFFDWFYWFIQMGSLISVTAVVYVQQEVSFFYGYLITAFSMALAIILLVVGRKHYILKPLGESYLTDTFRIIGGGLKGFFCCQNRAFSGHWLDRCKLSNGGKFSAEMVEGVKGLSQLFPIFLTFIFYWTIYGQGLTTYVLQGSYMRLKMTESLSIPAASLSAFEIVSLLVLIPLIDRLLYPGLRRLGFNFTPLRRIGVGMLFATGSVLLAGIIEVERKQFIKKYGTIQQHAFDSSVNASTMSVFYQVPQYILQGTSEALVSVTGLEFAYSQSPVELRGVVMGLCLAMIGVGYYIAGALASIVKHASNSYWYPGNLNNGNLEYYMFLLAGLMLLNAAAFLLLAMRYRYVLNEEEKNALNFGDITVQNKEIEDWRSGEESENTNSDLY